MAVALFCAQQLVRIFAPMSCQRRPHHHRRAIDQSEHEAAMLEQISARQREVVRRIAEGQNTKQIAAAMGITVKTVEAHRLRGMRRLKIENVAQLVRFAIRTGLVSLES